MLRDLLRGARYALSGAWLVLTRPGLWPYLLAPVLLTLVLFVVGAFGAWQLVDWAFGAVLPAPAEPNEAVSVLWRVAELVVKVWAVAVLAVGLYFASSIVATPFNDLLSQRVETMRLGPYNEPFSWSVLMGDLAQSLAHSILSLLLWLAVVATSLALNLVPGVGTLASVAISSVATALFIARESMDGCQSRRRMSFGHKLRIVRELWPILLGFGLLPSLVAWIPVVNVLVVPVAIAGGTLLYCDLERQGRIPDASGRPGFRQTRDRDLQQADPRLATAD